MLEGLQVDPQNQEDRWHAAEEERIAQRLHQETEHGSSRQPLQRTARKKN